MSISLPERLEHWESVLENMKQPAGFKELKVSPYEAPPYEASGLWFDFGNGARLVIDNEFNPRTLKKLMGVLAEC